MGRGVFWTGLTFIFIAALGFVFAGSYNVIPEYAANGTTISLVVFNVSNTGTSGDVLNSITVNLTGNIGRGNITNVTLYEGSNTYSNSSFSSSHVFPLVIPVGAAVSSQTNYTLNFTLSSGSPDNATFGANITSISAGSNVSYSSLPYSSGLSQVDTHPINISYLSGTPGAYANLSRNYIYANVSANDSAGKLVSVSILLYNSSSLVNSSVNLSVDSFSEAKSVNFTNLSDGTYWINVTVNDSYGLSGSVSRKIVLDTTPPNASASCSPSSVSLGQSITCSCSGADSGSGINSSATTPSLSTSAYPVGTSRYVCNVKDYAGNIATATVSYVVRPSGGGSAPVAEKTSHKYTGMFSLTSGEPYILNFSGSGFNSSLSISKISLEPENKYSGSFSLIQYFGTPAEVPSNNLSKVYQYSQVSFTNETGLMQSLTNANITFRVSKSWVSENNFNYSDVMAEKWDSGSSWSRLPLTYEGEKSGFYYYNTTVNSFSYFVVGAKNSEPISTVNVNSNSSSSANKSSGLSRQNSEPKSLAWIWIVVGIFIAAAIAFFVLRKKKVFQHIKSKF